MQIKGVLSFQFLSTLSACEILLSCVPQHVLLHIVLVELEVALFTLLLDVPAPVALTLDPMSNQLVLCQQIFISKRDLTAARSAGPDFLNSVNSQVEFKIGR